MYQNQCKQLPKLLKEWDAYKELRKTIDDFLDVLPLLMQLSDKAIRPRHRDQISQVDALDAAAPMLLLPNLMRGTVSREELDPYAACRMSLHGACYISHVAELDAGHRLTRRASPIACMSHVACCMFGFTGTHRALSDRANRSSRR